MPIFEYHCSKCEKDVEVILRADEREYYTNRGIGPNCATCMSTMYPVLSKANFTLKPGRGFYGTKPKS